MARRPTKVTFDGDDDVPIEWDVALGRLTEGYARGADYGSNRIRMGRGMTRRQQRNALLHEVGHHAWKRANLDQYLSRKTEELVLTDLLNWLLDTIRENPDFQEFLLED